MKKTIIAPSFQLLSNWCSMGCAGCGIKTAPPGDNVAHHFEKSFLENARSNIQYIKNKMDANNYEYIMVEQSGGEPSHTPELVELIGDLFSDSIHKIISNGLTTEHIFDYAQKQRERIMLVLSIDHQNLEFNTVRLGNYIKNNPAEALRRHNKVLKNLDIFIKNNIPVVISTMISKYNILEYINFIEWLEQKYTNAIMDGMLAPIPVSIVSFGNPAVGKLNPTEEQLGKFKEIIDKSNSITVKRTKDWLLKDLIGHYENKYRFFNKNESIESIKANSSKVNCDIYKYMVSFNFQDEEILKAPDEALFDGYACGIKVLGNMGYEFNHFMKKSYKRVECYSDRPCNIFDHKKYFRVDQTEEYLFMRDKLFNNDLTVDIGSMTGTFDDVRNGMCLLDDFDGVWVPFNSIIQGAVSIEKVSEFWAFFKKPEVIEKMNKMKENRWPFPNINLLSQKKLS